LRQFKSIDGRKCKESILVQLAMEILAARLMKQIAFSRWIGFCHGAVNPTNVTMSGGYLDFGTASFLPLHRNLVVARGGYSSFEEWKAVPSFIADLHHNIFYYGVERHFNENLVRRYNALCLKYYRAYAGTLALLASGLLPHEIKITSTHLRDEFLGICDRFDETEVEPGLLDSTVECTPPGDLALALASLSRGTFSAIQRVLPPAVRAHYSALHNCRGRILNAANGAYDGQDNELRGAAASSMNRTRTILTRSELNRAILGVGVDDNHGLMSILKQALLECKDLGSTLRPFFGGVSNELLS
jgi:hypothetical protein